MLARSLLAVGSQGSRVSNRWYKGLMNWRHICFSSTFRFCSKTNSEAVYMSSVWLLQVAEHTDVAQGEPGGGKRGAEGGWGKGELLWHGSRGAGQDSGVT